MAEIREDRDDTNRALVTHQPDGEHYLVEYCSLWQDDACVGSRITKVAGPLHYSDLGLDGGPVEASHDLFDHLDAYEFGPDAANDADWMQSEEDAGRVQYPIGAR